MILIPRPNPRINNEKVGSGLGLTESICQKNQNAKKAKPVKDDFHGRSGLAAARRRNLSILCSNLSLSPLQLSAKHIEECSVSVQQLHLMFGLATMNPIPIEHRHADLSVHAQVGFVFAGFNHDLNLGRVANH